jgi:hypothetical protein
MANISEVVTYLNRGYCVFRGISKNGKAEYSICDRVVKKAVIDQLVSDGRLKPLEDGLFRGFPQTFEYLGTQSGGTNATPPQAGSA